MQAAANGPSLARGAAVTTVATAVSRATGFLRVVVVAGAMGTTFLANTYQTANTIPNIVFELVAAGVLTSIFVPTFVSYLVAGDEEGGWHAANALATVAIVALIALSLVIAFAAPVLMRVLTLGVEDADLRRREIALGSTFLRLFAPQVAFYGAGMIMTGALHAYRRFALPAVAPIFNNIVVIVVYLTYAAMRGDRPPTVDGITDAEKFLLGAGTTLGVVAMTLGLVPQLLRLGWRPRFRFEPAHPAVRKGARLGVWALGYAGGYQAGLLVVLLLANKVEGGVAAYQWAFTFFYLPHALFAVPVFNVLFTAMSEHAARDEGTNVAGRLRDGLAMLAFILLPITAVTLATAEPLIRVVLGFGAMEGTGAELVARVLGAFVVGLPTYSAFLVLTRAFYAVGDTKTPALVNAGCVVVASVLGVVFFYAAPDAWTVAGLALAHSIAFAFGAVVLQRRFARTMGPEGTTRSNAATRRAVVGSVLALAAMATVRLVLPEGSRPEDLVNAVATAIVGTLVYAGLMRAMRAPELDRIARLVRKR